MVASAAYDHADRLRSYELLAKIRDTMPEARLAA